MIQTEDHRVAAWDDLACGMPSEGRLVGVDGELGNVAVMRDILATVD